MPYEKSVLVPLDADETFALITQPDRLRRWQAVTARVDLRAGGEYRWTIIPGNSARGTITEVEPGRRVVFTWGWEGSADLPPGASTVTITLEPARGRDDRPAGARGPDRRAGRQPRRGLEPLPRPAGHRGHRRRRGARRVGGRAAHLDALTCAEATLAVCQLVLRGVAEADYHQPTVCTEFTVDPAGRSPDRLGHVLGRRRARAPVPGPGRSPLEARVAAAAQPTLEAWHGRGLDGTVKVGPHEMPAGVALGILSIEFLVHAWDFAQATGQQVAVSDAVSRARPRRGPQDHHAGGPRAAGASPTRSQAGPDAGVSTGSSPSPAVRIQPVHR